METNYLQLSCPPLLSGYDRLRLELRGLHENHVHGPRRERAEGRDEQDDREADGGALTDGRLHPQRPNPRAVLESSRFDLHV